MKSTSSANQGYATYNKFGSFRAWAFLSRRLLSLAIVVWAGVLSGGSAAWAQGVTPHRDATLVVASAPDIAKTLAQIKKPTTRIELLQNVQFIVSQRLLKYDELYTAENLEHVFGGAKADWAWVDKTVWVTFENYVDFITPECMADFWCYIRSTRWDRDHKGDWMGSCTIDGVKFEFWRLQQISPPFVQANLKLILPADSGVNYERAKGIFAKADDELSISQIGDGRTPARQPHGNEILYIHLDKTVGSKLEGDLVFSPSANLITVDFSQDYK